MLGKNIERQEQPKKELNPLVVQSLITAGCLLFEKGDLDAADKCFERAELTQDAIAVVKEEWMADKKTTTH